MIRLINIFIVLLLISNTVLADDWRFSKEQGGVVVFERIIPESGYKEYRAEVEINAKPDQIVRWFQELEKISQWHYQTHSVEVLELISMTQAYLHIVSKPPWPIQARDLIAYVELTHVPSLKRIIIRLQNTDDKRVLNNIYIRMPKLRAEWVIFNLGDAKSRIIYRIYSEPGGEIPKWFYNSVAMDVPLYSLINLRDYFNDPGNPLEFIEK